MDRIEYLQKLKADKVHLKVYLSNGTMLTGKIACYDEDSIVLDKCLIFNRHIISLTPQ